MHNLGEQKLRLWAAGKSLRGAAKELGVDYHTYVRWLEGVAPAWRNLQLLRRVVGIQYSDWAIKPSAKLEREIERAVSKACG